MSDLHQDPSQESLEDESPLTLEVSRIAPHRAGESVSAARLSPRARIWRIAVVVSICLLLLVALLGHLPALSNQVGNAVQGLLPSPTATLPAGANGFAFTTDIPWTKVTLDGQRLAVPRFGVTAPLHLSSGEHYLDWTAEPFLPQSCTLNTDPSSGTSCIIIPRALSGNRGPLTDVVYLYDSLDNAPLTLLHPLIQTTQAALAGFSENVLPGELYNSGTIANGPLRATLKMQLQTFGTGTQGCWLNAFGTASADCSLDGTGCLQFCTLPWPVRLAEEANLPAITDEWLALGEVYSTWDYASPGGRTIAAGQPIDLGEAGLDSQLVLLRIRWDGRQWHVQPLFGPAQGTPITGDDGLQVADDPGCVAAEDIFHAESAGYSSVRFISGPNPAAGCLIEAALTSQARTPTPVGPEVEEYLVRFGYMVTVNTLAHLRLMQRPQADAYEQQLARQLAALPGGLTVNLAT